MTHDKFFDLFGEIDPAFIIAADLALQRAEERKVTPFTRRRVLTAALIAAVVAGLLTVTAYAAGLFGLQPRLIRDPAPTE